MGLATSPQARISQPTEVAKPDEPVVFVPHITARREKVLSVQPFDLVEDLQLMRVHDVPNTSLLLRENPASRPVVGKLPNRNHRFLGVPNRLGVIHKPDHLVAGRYHHDRGFPLSNFERTILRKKDYGIPGQVVPDHLLYHLLSR
jgi:hypothetical protein